MSGQNIELGIKLRYDGKEVDAGISLSRDSLQKFAAETKRAGSSASESFNTASASASSFGSVLKGAIGAVSTGALVYGIKSATMSLIDAQQAAQKLRNSLEYSAGSASAAAGEIAYLRDMARTLGMDFSTASVAYSKFAAATKDSGISAAQTKTVFEGIAAASARMGLSADETSGALLALSQMASKGTVQAEELRGQLGERLPGSFNIAAKAMGVTTAELGKMLEQGQVLASDFLPKFGEALKSQFQAPVASLTQEINRMSSAWALWKTELSEGSDGGGFKWLTNGLNESTAAMHALGNEAGIVHKILAGIGGFEASLLGAGKFDTQALQAQAAEKLAKANDRLAALQEKQASGKLNQVEREQLEHYTASVKAAREELQRLADVRGKETGIKLPDLKAEIAAQKAALDTRASAYLGDTTNGSKAAKIAAEIAKENKAFEAAVAGFSATDARYAKMLAEHNARIKEINAKAKPAAGTANDAKQEFDARLAAEKDYSETQITLVKQRVAQGLASEEQGASETLALQKEHFEKRTALLREQLAKTTDSGDKARIGQELQAVANDGQTAQAAYATALAKMADAREKYQRSVIETVGASTAQTEQENDALRAQIDTLGMTAEQLGAYEASKKRAAAAAEYLDAANLRETASTMEAAGGAADAVQYYRQLADARESAGKALSTQASLEVEKGFKQSAADAAKEWEKTSDKISDSLTDALMRGFDSGKSFAKNLCDATVNMFGTMVLRPVVQATVVRGLSAIGLAPSGSAASTLGSAGNLYSAGSGAYNLYNGGYNALYSSAATSSVGQSLGLGTTVYDATADTMMAGTTALGETVGAAIPYVGAAIAAISLLTSALGKRGGAKEGGGAGFDIVNGVAAQSTANGGRGASAYYTPTGGDATLAATLAPIANSAAALVKSIGGTLEGYSFSLGYDKDPKGTAGSRITSLVSDASGRALYGQTVDTGRDDAAFATAMQTELQREIIAAVKSADVAQIYKDVAASVDIMTASADDLSAIVTKLGALTTLRTAFDTINLGADALTTTLITAAGGIDALTTAASGYYDGYFTQSEKTAKLHDDLARQFGELNVTMPATRGEFRALVESLSGTGSAADATVGKLLSMQGTFGTWADAAAEAAKTAADTATAAAKASADALKETVDAVYEKLGSIGSARSNLIDAIFDAQLNGMDTSGQVSALKSRESELWASLDAGNLSAASTLQETILKRISLEESIKDDATKAQLESAQTLLDSMKSVAAYASSMRNEVLNLQAGDLSPLSYIDQLAAAQTQWQETLAKAQAGDTTAQSSLSSVGNAYLKEAQSYYGANSDYAATFASVTGGMSRFASSAPTETVIESQQTLVTQLTKAASEQTNTSKEQVAALRSIDSALAKQQGATEAQLRQNGEGYTAILAALKKIDERLAAVESTNRQAALA